MGYIAAGRPGRVYAPTEAPAVHEHLGKLNFMQYVFGVESDGKSRSDVMSEAMTKYARALGAHAGDKILSTESR